MRLAQPSSEFCYRVMHSLPVGLVSGVRPFRRFGLARHHLEVIFFLLSLS